MQCPRCSSLVPDEDDTCTACGSGVRVAVLEAVGGNAPERLHFLKPRDYVLGRARSSDLRITEPSVSKVHARIVHQAGEFSIEDQGSLHGVFVNATKVQRAQLTPGCQIQVGNVTLRFSRLDTEGSTGKVALFPWVEQQQLLLSLVQTLNSTLVLSEVLEQVLDAVMTLTRAERGFLLLFDEDPAAASSVAGMRIRAGRKSEGEAIEATVTDLSPALVRRAVERGRAVTTNDLLNEADGGMETLTIGDPRAAVCIPLRSPRAKSWGGGRHDVLGAIYVDSHALSFGAEVLRAGEGLARHAALAIENALLFEREQRTIEELRRTQTQLLHSERLATIGMMAAGIAHELNTPLTYILGNTELLGLRDLPAEQRELLDSIERGALRLKGLAQNLLAFSRPAKEEPVLVSMNDLIERSLEMCRYPILKSGVKVERDLDPELPKVRVVPTEIETALINLILNAVHVMARGGTLCLGSHRGADGTVEVTVRDTGPGIAEHVRSTLFEPFVTTKPEGQGTGLGLSTTLLILERHGGKIDFTTQTGEGTVFRIALPGRPSTTGN